MSEKGFESEITLDKTPHFGVTEEKPLKSNKKQSKKVDPKKFDFIDDFGAFDKMRKSKGNNFAWQKLMGMRLINALETSTRPKRNNVATEIIRYAASNTDISTYFIKVE